MKSWNFKTKRNLMSIIGLILLVITALLMKSYSVLLFGTGVYGAVLFTPSALVEQLSKKIGSVVFSTNHYNPFARIRVKPINPRSAAQTAQRDLLSNNSKAWKALSQAEILGWNVLAGMLPKKNRLGQQMTNTGENLYNSCNNNISSGGGSAISTPPTIDQNDVPSLLGVAITCAAGAVSMAFTPGTVATNIVEVKASSPLSGGRTYNSNFRVIGTFASNATSPQVLTTMYTGKFGIAPVAGQVVFFEIRVIDNLSGFATLNQKYRVVAS